MCDGLYGTTICEDASEDVLVYDNQGISGEEYENATNDDLTKTQSEEEEEIICTVAQQANDSVIMERKRRQLFGKTLTRNQTIIIRVMHL